MSKGPRIDITVRASRLGDKHVAMNDSIVVVPEEGDPIDISGLVRGFTATTNYGEPRLLELRLYANGAYTTEHTEEDA